MGLLANIFGTGNVIEKGMELIDNLHTSDEEEILAKAQAKVSLMNAYAPFKLAQRVLAFMFAGVFLASFLTVMVMVLLGRGSPDNVVTVLNQFWIGEIMMTITTFYFGGGFLEGVFNSRKDGTGMIKQIKVS